MVIGWYVDLDLRGHRESIFTNRRKFENMVFLVAKISFVQSIYKNCFAFSKSHRTPLFSNISDFTSVYIVFGNETVIYQVYLLYMCAFCLIK